MWFSKKDIDKSEYSVSDINEMFHSSKSQRELAFTYIYNKYSNKLYAYCLRITDSKQDADDLFQETFTSFLNINPDKIEFSNISAYLIKIARNIELNNKRDKKKLSYNFEDFDFLFYNDENDKLERKEEMEIISRAMELLEFNHREIFVLRQYNNMDYDEISEITNTSIPALRNRYFRAREKLKEILEPILKEKINI